MIPMNMVFPFLYIMDIVKDIVQFMLLVEAVGGFSLVLEYWSSFSSTVSRFILFSLFYINFHTFGSILYGITFLQNILDKNCDCLTYLGNMVYFSCNSGSNHHCWNNYKKKGLLLDTKCSCSSFPTNQNSL